jgi:hypothetical protein
MFHNILSYYLALCLDRFDNVNEELHITCLPVQRVVKKLENLTLIHAYATDWKMGGGKVTRLQSE